MSTNWKALQVPADKNNKLAPAIPHGIRPRYLTMGSFHADLSRDGRSRKIYPGAGAPGAK